MKKLLLSLLSLTIALGVSVSIAAAQTPKTSPAPPNPTSGRGQALEIAPPVINLSGDPGQTVQTRISLRDISANNLVVTNEINDFVTSGEDGTPKILLNPNETSPYSMKSWVVALPQFTLVPKQIQQLNITIKIPANAAPGGYYSTIRFTGRPPEVAGTGVSLSASLGALVLLKVNGQAQEKLSIAEFSTNSNGRANWLFESTPINFVERIKNDGNVHEQPTGTITIIDMFGKKVATIGVNQPPRNILPGSIRKFQEPLDSSTIGDKILLGKYTAKLDLTYSNGSQTLSSTITFWVIPYRLIAAVIISLILLFFIVRYALRHYRDRILDGYRGGRRR